MGGAEDYAGRAPVTADVQRELAEALRNHRDGATVTGDREQDYRPGAPCMDCGDYPGPRHEASDCPRAVARALLPTVQRIAYLRAAEEVRTVRQWLLETGRADADTLRQLRDRVDQIAAEVTVTAARAAALDPAGADSGEGR